MSLKTAKYNWQEVTWIVALKVSRIAFVCWGRYNKLPETGGLNSECLFLEVVEVWKSEIRVQHSWVLVRTLLQIADRWFIFSHGRWRVRVFLASL